MKVRITLRDRDSIEECVRYAVYTKYPPYLPDFDEERKEFQKLIEDKMKNYLRWKEFITIELDLGTGLAEIIIIQN